MKTLTIIPLIISMFIHQNTMAQTREITELTNSYYGIKDALVSGDGNAASSHAEAFINSLDDVSRSNLNTSQQKTWLAQVATMKSVSEAIAKTTDVEKQREQLNDLSVALFATLKDFRENNREVFYQYCPMKKAYWLSIEKDIKNPYYGNKMLTCGSVKETLK